MAPSPPVDLIAVLLTALLNPVTVVVAFWLGRKADEWQKVPVAAFAGALAGSLVEYLTIRFGLTSGQVGRAAAGVFIAQFLFGLIWAALAFRFFAR